MHTHRREGAYVQKSAGRDTERGAGERGNRCPDRVAAGEVFLQAPGAGGLYSGRGVSDQALLFPLPWVAVFVPEIEGKRAWA
jgi:hypothetical protein